MRTRSAILASFASGAVLLIGWQAGNQQTMLTSGAVASPRQGTSSPSATTTPPVTSPTGAPAPAAAASTSVPSAVKNGAYAGSQIQTPYGNIQVKAVISGGKITDVIPLQMTDVGSTSVEIDQQAVPMLRSEVLSNQSAKVDMISGATYTSEGYLMSLQAALDSALFKG
ncbi:MAG TPA: FMN-binding protein [Terrimesophilobacter sp.]|nr:FMN-binding protein [Terrimesophilobacter sp.]